MSVDVIHHARAESAAGEARAAQLPAEQTARTMVLHAPAGYRFTVISGADRLDLHKAADELEVTRHELRLRQRRTSPQISSYQVGAIPPSAPIPCRTDPRLLEVRARAVPCK